MTQHAELLAIKLLIKSLNYSDTHKKPLIDFIDSLIETENLFISDEQKTNLQTINNLINEKL